MTAYLAAPFLACLVVIIRDMAASRRLHRWPYAEAPSPPPVDEFAAALRAVEREREALEALLERGRLLP